MWPTSRNPVWLIVDNKAVCSSMWCVYNAGSDSTSKTNVILGSVQHRYPLILTLCVPCVIFQCVNDQRDSQFL